MSIVTIGDEVALLRKKVKANHQDHFLTDRYLYTSLMRYVKLRMKQLDEKSRLMSFSSIFQTLDFVELIEVDKVEAGCTGIKSGVKVMRTKNEIPVFVEGYSGPIIRSITSLDGMFELQMTQPSNYLNIIRTTNYKYNKTKYCWYLNNHLYFPDVEWPAVRIDGVFEEDISAYKCGSDCDENSLVCKTKQEQKLFVPDHILAEVEGMAYNDFIKMLGLPSDQMQDNNNPAR